MLLGRAKRPSPGLRPRPSGKQTFSLTAVLLPDSPRRHWCLHKCEIRLHPPPGRVEPQRGEGRGHTSDDSSFAITKKSSDSRTTTRARSGMRSVMAAKRQRQGQQQPSPRCRSTLPEGGYGRRTAVSVKLCRGEVEDNVVAETLCKKKSDSTAVSEKVCKRERVSSWT